MAESGHATRSIAAAVSSNGAPSEERPRRRRLPLSCRECRNKKLSCDRHLPCHRCVRSGRPEQCSFETGPRLLPVVNSADQIQELRTEVAQLKELLANAGPQSNENPSSFVAVAARDAEAVQSNQTPLLNEGFDQEQGPAPPAHVTKNEISDPKERSPRGYYRQHTLFRFFDEMPQLFPFIKETADEFFKPRGVSLRKGKFSTDFTSLEPSALEELLPPKEDTDALVSFYLKYFEQLHRVVHIPTFERQYADFWIAGQARHPAMTALVLAMISMSTPVCSSSLASTHRGMPQRWISACERWLGQQALKGRKLSWYQISCLVYLAKRINSIKKKRFWIETGALIQNAVLDRLHCDPSPRFDSPYMREMKRRIWAVLRELDLQNSLEYELPTLLHNIDSNVIAPTNLDDSDFDEVSKVFPASQPASQMTCMSYQSQSCRSWPLRLEISRHLFSSGIPKTLNYEDVLRYTHEITQALDSLPSWTAEDQGNGTDPKSPLLASAVLQFQLKEYVLALHRPYLQRKNNRSSLSEMICYHTSRDILLLNRKLADFGIQSLTLLREDLLMASLSVTRIILLQPRSLTNTLMTTSEATVDLLEQCLLFMENRYLRCLNGEPWCPLMMSGAIMLLKIHLGRVSHQAAKSSCAQWFLDLYYKHFIRQETFLLDQYPSTYLEAISNTSAAYQLPLTPSASTFQASEQLDYNLDFDSFDFDMDLDASISWEFPLPM